MLMITTSAGPEMAQLVSPQGLFRLVLKSKSNTAKAVLSRGWYTHSCVALYTSFAISYPNESAL